MGGWGGGGDWGVESPGDKTSIGLLNTIHLHAGETENSVSPC